MKIRISGLAALSFVSFLSFAPLPCHAEDGAPSVAHGRLPDGRAFRTDSNGHKLVDYIAELEVNVEALNRRVLGLEDEVAEKERQLDRLRAGKPEEGGLVERDLTGGTSSRRPLAEKARAPLPVCGPELDKAQAEVRVLRERLAKMADEQKLPVSARSQQSTLADRELAALRSENQAKERQIDRMQKENAALEASGGKLRSELRACSASQGDPDKTAAELRQVRTRYDSARREIALLKAEHAKGESKAGQKLSQRVAELEAIVAGKDVELAKLRDGQAARIQEGAVAYETALQKARSEVADCESRHGKVAAERSRESDDTIARLRTETRELNMKLMAVQIGLEERENENRRLVSEYEARLEDRGQEARAAIRAGAFAEESGRVDLDRERLSLRTALSRLNNLVIVRDKLFDQYRHRRGASQLEIRPSRLQSEDGQSLGLIASRLRASSSPNELALLKEGVDEIRAKVEDDILLVKRMTPRG